MKKSLKSKGFTIIEVVLVLAIAGLIFSMAFIALPALQRSQRDTQRKNNLALILSALDYWNNSHRVTVSDNYSSRNNSTNGFCTFFKNYVNEENIDPTTGEPFQAALWGSSVVVNCRTGEETDRGEFDSSVQVDPNKVNDSWPKMEIGDMQFDNSAYCDGEEFNDNVGKASGYRVFALRIRLEGGGYYCVDNGAGSYKKP